MAGWTATDEGDGHHITWDGTIRVTQKFKGDGSQLTNLPVVAEVDPVFMALSGAYLLNTGDTATGNYTFDGTTLHIDSTSDRVGIGTTSPEASLDINGTTGAQLFKTEDVDGYGFYNIQNQLNFNYGRNANAVGYINYRGYEYGTTQFRDLDIGDGKQGSIAYFDGSSGNVGIGTTAPENKLHIWKATSGAADTHAQALLTLENDTEAYIQFHTPNATTAGLLFGDPENDVIGQLTYTHSTNLFNFKTAGSDRMVIDGTGNVGIGTTEPGSDLEVNGLIESYYDKGGGGSIWNQGLKVVRDGTPTQYTMLSHQGGSTHLISVEEGGGDDGIITFQRHNAGSGTPKESMRIDSSGNVGIGTVSPDTKLHVSGALTLSNAAEPTTPTNAYVMWASGAALWGKGGSGTKTIIGAA